MKKLLLLSILIFTTLLAQDQSVYTLTGQKDPRLDARYSITYVATNLKEGCSSRGYTTGTMKPSFVQRSMSVPDGNYTINLPIYMTPEEDKAGCGYRFGGLELTMRRLNDHKYAKFQLFGKYVDKNPITGQERSGNRIWPIYHGSRSGDHSPYVLPRSETPLVFRTNKNFFRIAPDTTFTCMTFRTEDPRNTQEYTEGPWTDFTCTLQMKLDTEGGKYHFKECKTDEDRKNDINDECGTMSNPDFGVDEITSDTLHIDIVIDESKCLVTKISERKREQDIFRAPPAQQPSIVKSIKSIF